MDRRELPVPSLRRNWRTIREWPSTRYKRGDASDKKGKSHEVVFDGAPGSAAPPSNRQSCPEDRDIADRAYQPRRGSLADDLGHVGHGHDSPHPIGQHGNADHALTTDGCAHGGDP